MSKLSYTLSKDNLGIISATSNSYGYVRLESPEEAETAIKELHGSDVGGSNIVIEKFNKEKKADKSINNIYVKEFPTTWTDEDLGNLFKKYGELGSVKVMFDDEGKSKGFGFVCFQKPECVDKAVELNGKEIDGNILYVSKAEKKTDRIKALEKSMARRNLYIRNFPKEFSEAQLQKFFEQYGNVSNVRIMVTSLTDPATQEIRKESKGFGFVCFETAETAAKVVELANANQLQFDDKQIFAAFYETRSQRENKFSNMFPNPTFPQMGGAGDPQDLQNKLVQFFSSFSQMGGFQNFGQPGGMPAPPPQMGQGQFGGQPGFGGQRQFRRGGYGGGNYGRRN